jgi:ATP-dependent RNA helicase SUPV3L1/SUV3
MGLTTSTYARLLRLAGFQAIVPRALAEAAFGPPEPLLWRWRPPRREAEAPRPAPAPRDGAFALLAELVR